MLDLKLQFDIARRAYPSVRRGLNEEWANFLKHLKKHKLELKGTIPLLLPAIRTQISWRAWLKSQNQPVRYWKDFSTWINNSCWTDEMPEYNAAVSAKRTQTARIAKTKSQMMAEQGATLSSILEQRRLEYDEEMKKQRERVMGVGK
jgi:hypothetical protein